MDYDKLNEAITERTKAIIPVDIAGRCVIMVESMTFWIIKETFQANNNIQEIFNRVMV